MLFLIGQVRGDGEAEGPDPGPVVVPNGPKLQSETEPVAIVGSRPKFWLEPFFVQCGRR